MLVAAGNRVTLGATAPWQVADAAGNKTALSVTAPLTLRPSLDDRRGRADGPADDHVEPPAARERPGVSRQADRSVGRQGAPGRRHRRARGIRQGRRRRRDAEDLAGRRTRGPGGRRALLRASPICRRPAPSTSIADGRSQVYGGVAVETPATNAAVAATRGKVVLWQGKVADTVYSVELGRPHRFGARRHWGWPFPTSRRSPTRTTACRRTTTGARSSSPAPTPRAP